MSFAWGNPAKDLTVAEITQKVETAQSAVKDVQMDLNMEMKDSLSGAVQKMKGQIKIKNPNRVFVHFSQPNEQFLYISGPLAQMYQPSQKMVYQQKSGKGTNAGPVYVGVGKQLKNYIEICKVSIKKNSNDEVQLLFKPYSPDSAGFDEMKVFIHKKDWWPYQMEMETTSATTKASFSNFSFNKGLLDGLFEFKAPKGAEVVDGLIY